MGMNRNRIIANRIKKAAQAQAQEEGGGVPGRRLELPIAVSFVVVVMFAALLLYSTPTSKVWVTAPSGGWKPSSAPRSNWPAPPKIPNGYLRVHCNGGLNEQRIGICNAVLVARIMGATLVLPELDANFFWHNDSGFQGIYDVEHFIRTLRSDVHIVEKMPDIKNKGKKMKAFRFRPPRNSPISWYSTVALQYMRKHRAIYLTPFSHSLAEEIDNPEYQRLRCRVNYHALKFKPHIMELSNAIVNRLRAQGHFMTMHLRFEMDLLSFAGCFDIFTLREQKKLKIYRQHNFPPLKLVYNERRAMGICPLTPEEVGLILRAMGYDDSTRIYLADEDIFGGERFMKPFRSLFPRLENLSTVDTTGELGKNTRGSLGSAVDYMVCLLSDIYMPTYDGPRNFENNLPGHRLYNGFRSVFKPDRRALAPIFIAREKGETRGFEAAVKHAMLQASFRGPHKREKGESFYTNPWPECFCKEPAKNPADRCPPENQL